MRLLGRRIRWIQQSCLGAQRSQNRRLQRSGERRTRGRIIRFRSLGRTLSCLNSTWIRQDPSELARTAELRAWFEKDGRNLVLPDLSNGSEPSDRQSELKLLHTLLLYWNYSAPWKTFGQIIAEGIGLGDRPEYICVKGICTLIRKDTAVYRVRRR